jgi:hypothetical protein
MKTYWEIPGPSKAPQEPCIAFYKYDGSNIRAEWSRKNGWHKFGSRYVLIDEQHSDYAEAIPLFMAEYAESLNEILRTNKAFRGVERATAFCEYYGENSFAGWHDPHDPKQLILFDIQIHKKGFVLPRDFVNHFGHLRTAEVIYEGNFSKEFVEDVKAGKYPLKEGVVAKGVNLGKKSSPQHGLWMAKVKTKWWFDLLKKRASEDEAFRKILKDNQKEQA